MVRTTGREIRKKGGSLPESLCIAGDLFESSHEASWEASLKASAERGYDTHDNWVSLDTLLDQAIPHPLLRT